MNTDRSPVYHSRRDFLKSAAVLTLGAGFAGRSLAAVLTQKGAIALVVAPDDALAGAVPPQWALGELEAALIAQGATVRRVTRTGEISADEFGVVVAAMASPVATQFLQAKKTTAPTEAEALALVSGEFAGRSGLLVAGTDARGLVYALTELADRVRCLATSRAALEFAAPVIERPASRTRSVVRQFCSEVEDKVWFYDHEFWRRYLTMLATARVNRFSFTTGMGYNYAEKITDGYFLFTYPFLLAVPGYEVRPRGLSDEERARNLAMLKFIAEETARRGLKFQLGLWTVAVDWPKSPAATYVIDGLTPATHAAYCRDALALLLKEIPTIEGLTFRVHEESGVPTGSGNFWETHFRAVAQCGRRVEIDLHAKNMEPEVLEFALATGQPTVISPKYCGEQLGLPYHPAAIREKEMVAPEKFTDPGTGVLRGNRGFTRYGYADTLAENRTWDVVFRIWPGTQRFLLNGDPTFFAGYGRNAAFGGAAGIEWSEPLVFKGRMGSGRPGGRLGYADTSLVTKYDFEKYRYTYRLWGRLGYNPDTAAEVWQRDLRYEFGEAAPAVEAALAAATRVLPLFTLAHGAAADCMVYWPEIYTNIPVANDQLPHPYRDTLAPKLFGNVSSFDPQLFLSPDQCGDALLTGTVTGKYTPLEVAYWLDGLADRADQSLTTARVQLTAAASSPKFRRIEEDVLIQAGLARYFAAKLRVGVLWRIHAVTRDPAAGAEAVAHYVAARAGWAAMAERAKKVYRSDITYGSNASLQGHWLDRLAAIDDDIADLRHRLAAAPAPAGESAGAASRALQAALATPSRPPFAGQHRPPATFQPGQPLAVALATEGSPPRRVVLHYRHVNQAERWQSVELTAAGSVFRGEIPAAYATGRWALQYYFQVETGPAAATLFPPLAGDLDNVPYFVVRCAK